MIAKTTAPAARRRTLRVLIIDDSIDDVRRIRDLLEQSGQFVAHAARGTAEAERLLEDGTFDCALVAARIWADPQAPLVGYLREKRPDVAVVLLVDAASELETLPAIKLGAHDFLARSQLEEAQLSVRIIAACEENRALRRRDTMVRWLEREARTDHLTGLHNRHAFDERLRDACATCRGQRRPITLILADLAGTRIVNEVHGHDVGDDMIRRAAAVISHSIRGEDFAARIGGDDFGIILPGSDLALGRLIARRIAQEAERRNLEEWSDLVPVTLTFGVATGIDCDASELFAAADQQLARRHGSASVVALPRHLTDSDGPSVA